MSAVKEIYELIKQLFSLAEKFHDAEMQERLLQIQAGLFDLRDEIENLKEQNRDLSSQIEELEKSKNLEDDLEMTKAGQLIRKSESGRGICYCPACWENFRKLFPLVQTQKSPSQCCNCGIVIKNGYVSEF